MEFYGRVLSSTSKNWLNFGGDLGIVRWVNEQKNTVIVVAYPDRGEGNDPEPFFFFFFFLGGWVVFHNQGSTFYSGQYGSNDLPRPRRSALSECF